MIIKVIILLRVTAYTYGAYTKIMLCVLSRFRSVSTITLSNVLLIVASVF